MVSIRLARAGAKKRPFYHIVVSDVRKPRDSGYIERIGYFNPVARGQEVRLHVVEDRANYWLSQGAQPTDRVKGLLKIAAKNAAIAKAEAEKESAKNKEAEAA